jgi:hypothetical protein
MCAKSAIQLFQKIGPIVVVEEKENIELELVDSLYDAGLDTVGDNKLREIFWDISRQKNVSFMEVNLYRGYGIDKNDEVVGRTTGAVNGWNTSKFYIPWQVCMLKEYNKLPPPSIIDLLKKTKSIHKSLYVAETEKKVDPILMFRIPERMVDDHFFYCVEIERWV